MSTVSVFYFSCTRGFILWFSIELLPLFFSSVNWTLAAPHFPLVIFLSFFLFSFFRWASFFATMEGPPIINSPINSRNSQTLFDASPDPSGCPVGWDCRIHWLHLCRGVRPPNEYPGYDTKQSDREVPVMQGPCGIRSTPSLPLLPGPHWPGVVAPDRALCMG